jgi:hypothetical protein
MTQSTRRTKEACWQLSGEIAALEVRNLKASIDLAAPHLGLRNLCAWGHPLAGFVLGVPIDTGDQQQGATLADHYQRGRDLVAQYEQTDDRPFRATVYWRALDLVQGIRVAAIELMVSVQTNLLDSTPQLYARSRVEAARAIGVDNSSESELPSPIGDLSQEKGAACAPACVVLPLRSVDATYCEMIHPSDWRGLEAQRIDGGVELAWSLVGHFMEKGVVRRTRVRGMFLPGRPEHTLVRDLYAEFAASPPPLAT